MAFVKEITALAAVCWPGVVCAFPATIKISYGGAGVGALLRIPVPAGALKAKPGQAVTLVDEKGGQIQARSFAIEPTGTRLFVANQDSDNSVVFRVDPTRVVSPLPGRCRSSFAGLCEVCGSRAGDA